MHLVDHFLVIQISQWDLTIDISDQLSLDEIPPNPWDFKASPCLVDLFNSGTNLV